MTLEELNILCTDDVRRAIAENRGRDPLAVALDSHVPHAAAVATQVKYLARAESKLPSYAAAGCILPSLAFEQSSSETCAARRYGRGRAALDLTCGLGVDTYYASRRFDRVVALERDEITAAVARENFRRLGAANIEVICASAEEYLKGCGEEFDVIYADPDRRSQSGRKMVCLEDCSPDMAALLPEISRCGRQLAVKLSPMFDVDEAFARFGEALVETVSLGGECKEVNVVCDGGPARISAVAITAAGEQCEATFARGDSAGMLSTGPFDADRWRYLGVPDAALRKARLVARTLGGRADVRSQTGFVFADEPLEGVPCRWHRIASIEPYNPKQLRRRLHGLRVEILRRDFPQSTAEICRACGIREGGDIRAAFTRIGDSRLFIMLE